MPNWFEDNEDLRWYVDKGLDWARLTDLAEFGFTSPDGPKSAAEAVESYRDVLSLLGRFAAEEIAPRIAAIERRGHRLEGGRVVSPPEFEEIFAQLRDLGLYALPLPRELGGAGCPLVVSLLGTEVLGRADISVLTHYGFHWGIALALLTYSVLEGSAEFDRTNHRFVRTRFDEEIREIVAGRAWGSMDITEPHAGSDMAALRTRAEQGGDGSWRVTGEKAFITSGHGRHHLLVARTEPSAGEGARPGLDGLSLFLVRAYDDDGAGGRRAYATIDRLEEKLGHHGSVTTALSFDGAPAQLVGRRGDGFRNMLLLMNNARLQVGLEALGLSEAALRLARAWAAERRSMGKTLDRHELVADCLDEMQTDVQGLRALAYHGAFHEETGQRLRMQALLLHDEGSEGRARLLREARPHEREARRATPLLKYLAGEKAVEIARRALQIHGGFGYLKDYPCERLVRDALVVPIYEGTSQIQALMAMKDALSDALRSPRAFLAEIAATAWRAGAARDEAERRTARLQSLALGARRHLLASTAVDKLRSLRGVPASEWRGRLAGRWDPKRDFAFALLHAERLTRLMADAEIARILLDQARRDPARREVVLRWLERAEPRARFLHEEITTTGRRLLARLRAVEGAGGAAA